MKKYILLLLAATITWGVARESRSGLVDSGTCNDSGTCLWSLDSAGTLTVSAKDGAGKVNMSDYSCEETTCPPWKDNMQQIQNVVIGDKVVNIGRNAFENAINLKTVSGMKDVLSIESNAFIRTKNLTDITLPDRLTQIAASSFYGTGLTSITIPASVTTISTQAFMNADNLSTITVSSDVDVIRARAFQGTTALHDVNCIGTETECGALMDLMKSRGATFDDDEFHIVTEPTANCGGYSRGVCRKCQNQYLKKENKCISAAQGCGENFKLNDGECDRLRYTPADAAKVLHDDNTNSVTITFKK